MNLQDFNEMVSKLMREGKSPLDAVKAAQNSGLFDESVIDAFWDDFNKRRGA